MAQPIEVDPTITAAVGGPWPDDPSVYEWQVNGPGGPVTMRFQWRANGAAVELPTGNIAIADKRAAAF